MTGAVALERLPRAIATLLDEGVANLAAIANELDALVHRDASARDAITRREDDGDRIVHDIIAVAGESLRIGPDRARLIDLAQAVDDVIDALETVAWSWPDPPLPELSDPMLALRDAARDAGHAVAALARQEEPGRWLARSREREEETRRLSRAARAWLLVEQHDLQLALRGHDTLRHADAALRACTRLRERLNAHALA